MLENGFAITTHPGIGDKHIPLIHNVTNTDVVVAISDRATDELDVLFNSDEGRRFPRAAQGCARRTRRRARALRVLAICNVLAAIKTAKVLGLGPTTR